VTLDLFSPLKVVSWASAHSDCPMRYTINSADEMVIIFGNGSTEFELSLDGGALHTLVRLGAEALDKMATCVGPGEGAPSLSSHLVPGDHAFHDDKQLIADLAELNEQLSRYMLRYLAADALQAEPLGAAEERALAEVMTDLARKVQERANQRASSDTPPEFEGEAMLRQLTSGRPSER
jgi:hypothetical protein